MLHCWCGTWTKEVWLTAISSNSCRRVQHMQFGTSSTCQYLEVPTSYETWMQSSLPGLPSNSHDFFVTKSASYSSSLWGFLGAVNEMKAKERYVYHITMSLHSIVAALQLPHPFSIGDAQMVLPIQTNYLLYKPWRKLLFSPISHTNPFSYQVWREWLTRPSFKINPCQIPLEDRWRCLGLVEGKTQRASWADTELR